jgi:hypothetical protein
MRFLPTGDHGDVENSLSTVLERGKQRFRMATTSPSSARRRPVVALPGGSPAEVRGKTTSLYSGEAPRPVS